MRKRLGGKSVLGFKHIFTSVIECKNIIPKTFPSEFSLWELKYYFVSNF